MEFQEALKLMRDIQTQIMTHEGLGLQVIYL